MRHERIYNALRIIKDYLVRFEIVNEFKPYYLYSSSASFANKILPEECDYEWQALLSHISPEDFGIRNPNTKLRDVTWIKISSENRLVFAKHIGSIMHMLYDAGYNVSYHDSWRWECGQYVPVYELFISVTDKEPIKYDVPVFCLSSDERADRSVFELLRESNHEISDAGYEWTKDGFILTVYDKKQTYNVIQIFHDCKIDIVKKKIDKDTKQYTMTVCFP
jgi:hypothetical protein